MSQPQLHRSSNYRYQSYLENGIARLAISKPIKVVPSEIETQGIFTIETSPTKIDSTKRTVYKTSLSVQPSYARTLSDEANQNCYAPKTPLKLTDDFSTQRKYSYDDRPKVTLGNSIGKSIYNVRSLSANRLYIGLYSFHGF